MIKRGFTLIEMLLYIALVSGIATASVKFVTDVTAGRVKASVQENVMNRARFITQRIEREIRASSGITSLATNDLCLTMVDAARNPTRIYLVSGVVRIGWGGSCATSTQTYDLNGTEVTVTGLNFTNLSSGTSKNIKFAPVFTGSTITNRQEWQFTTSMEGSSEIRSN